MINVETRSLAAVFLWVAIVAFVSLVVYVTTYAGVQNPTLSFGEIIFAVTSASLIVYYAILTSEGKTNEKTQNKNKKK